LSILIHLADQIATHLGDDAVTGFTLPLTRLGLLDVRNVAEVNEREIVPVPIGPTHRRIFDPHPMAELVPNPCLNFRGVAGLPDQSATGDDFVQIFRMKLDAICGVTFLGGETDDVLDLGTYVGQRAVLVEFGDEGPHGLENAE
jgi:hypothetical protein